MPRLFVLGFALAGCVPAAQRLTPSAVPVNGHADVHISADDANVHVTAADVAQVAMQVESRGYDPGDLDISMTPHGNRIDIVAKTRHHWNIFNVTIRSLHIDVVVPRDSDVVVRTDDGSVTTDAIAGNLDVHTGDGSVIVHEAHGLIKLHTGDGSIHAEGLDGAVDATTGDGNVTLDGRFDVLAVKTGDGSLTATARPGSRMMQPWRVRTGDGSVELDLPRNLQAHLDAETGDGSVSSDIPLHHGRGDLNGGGPPIVVRTGDGSIHLAAL
jgi:hypothetical protein